MRAGPAFGRTVRAWSRLWRWLAPTAAWAKRWGRRRYYRTMSLLVLSSMAFLLAEAPAAGTGAPSPVFGRAAPTRIVVQLGGTGTISKYLFGANLLWASDAEGAFNPATDAFYPGFVSMLRHLHVSVLRYPGGTTSDSFHWQRAIGPRQDRTANEPYGMQAAALSDICCVLDGPQPSNVGPDEFGRLLDQTGAAGLVTVNFATGTAREAADFVAYMTAPVGKRASTDPAQPSYWAALRARNGHPAPYNVPFWEVGNEQYFPGQYGWRSGRVVNVGTLGSHCPVGEMATCLYAFGGTTEFTGQAVGRFADEMPDASYSTGAPNQAFYLYFPPAVPGSVTVYVDGRPWAEVADLAKAGPGERVFTVSPTTGRVLFGDGHHGGIPPKGARVTASYESGPHDGFVEFYQAMKAMNPRISVCESEGSEVGFLRLMGRRYAYDCVELHDYARPADFLAPLNDYEQDLMTFPSKEGAALGRLQEQIRHYAGRDVPVLVTEYGQLVAPVPAGDPQFNLSLDEGLLVGAQLTQWIDHRVVVAQKYLVDSDPFLPGRTTTALSIKQVRMAPVLQIDRAIVGTGLSANSAMVAHQGPVFVAEPTGEVIGLMARLAGARLLRTSVLDGPRMGRDGNVPELGVTAGASRQGWVDLVVINASPVAPVAAQVDLEGWQHTTRVRAYVIDGPSPLAYNTPWDPRVVTVTAGSSDVPAGAFKWTFPAHSLSLLQMGTTKPVGAELLALR